MDEIRETQVGGGPRRGFLTLAIWGAALVGAAAVLYVIAASVIKPADAIDLNSLKHGEMAKLDVSTKLAPPPTTPFLDAAGHQVTLAQLKAPVVVVNLWATWCAPCVKEMPTLAKLQAAYPGQVLVAPISMDRLGDRERARAFIADHAPLPFYQDPNYALAFALDPPADGFPTTILYDRHGHERARLAGGADWNSPDARAVVEALLKAP